MKFFVYCRKSTDREDRQILSTEAQQRLLKEYAAERRFEVVAVYVENQSAYKVGRPLFNEMLDRIERGEADGILTYHLTRLARNSFDGGRLIYLMDVGSIRQISTIEKSYTDNADDKFIMQIHFAMAKKSSDDTSQFVRRDVESKLLRGELPGKVPLGYLNIKRDGHISGTQADPEKEELLKRLGRPLRREEIDPLDGPLVRKLFEEAATGAYSLAGLRRLSVTIGLRTRSGCRRLSKYGISKLLTNPYYYGALAYNGHLYDTALLRERTGNPEARVQHEPLISRDLFERVQEAIAGRRKGRLRRHSFSFGGCVLRCGECGCPITAEIQKGHVYYHCTYNGGPCAQRRWTREEDLDRQIESILAAIRLPQEFVDYALVALRKAHATEAQISASARRRLQGRVNSAQQQLDALLQLKLSPGNREGELLSDDEYLRQKRELRKELEIAEEQLKAVSGQSRDWVDDCEAFFRFTQRVVRAFADGSPEDKKTLALLIGSNLTLTDRIVAWEYHEPYATLASLAVSGKRAILPSEPAKIASGSQEVLKSHEWCRLLTAIRTYRLPEIARRIAAQ